MKKINIILMLLAVSLVYMVSCTPAVSQQEYDDVSNELVAARNQIASLQDKLDEAEALKVQYEDLLRQNRTLLSEFEVMQNNYEELMKKNEMAMGEFETLQGRYEELASEFQELSDRCQGAEVVEEPKEIIEEDVEQAMFELINRERRDNGLNELEWGIYLYREAQNNNKSMAENQRLEYSTYGSYQEAFRATGYPDMDTMIDAILKIWRNTENYELKFLNDVTIYGAVAVLKSGDIFYISYTSSIFK